MMLNSSVPQEFRPLVGNRRTELFVWILAIIILLVALDNPFDSRFGLVFSSLLVIFFFLSAVLISFGNWVERRTTITLTATGTEYKNGIRQVQIRWEEVKEIRIYPSGIGSKVVVYSAQEYFSFQALTELTTDNRLKLRYGFEKGEEILEMIMQQSKLRDVEKQNAEQYYYYLRE